MATIFGALRISDTDRVFNSTVGQRVIWDEAQRYIAAQNAALNGILATFVDETTAEHQRRYRLPGGGMLQRRGGQAQSGAVKASGYWDVAFPIDEYGDQVAGDDVSLAYMTAGELDRHIQTVNVRNINTVRFEVLRALLSNVAWTYPDSLHGNLTIQPLANGDTVVYPPVIGSASEATDDHYVVAGYAATDISNTNDPVAGIAIPELEEHFGQVTGGSPVAMLINTAQVAKVSDLAAIVPVPDNYVIPGDNVTLPTGLPMLPGRVIGRHTNGAWVAQWDWIPSGYAMALHLEAPKPLVKRVDPADTGLPSDLALVSQDAEYPFRAAHWRNRFGFGVGNRLNGVVIQFKASGSYDVPTAYA